MKTRALLKRMIKRPLQSAAALAAPAVWRLRTRRLAVLMYHRVYRRGDPRASLTQPGMYVFSDTFKMHLATLRKYFVIVPLDEWITNARHGRPVPDRACAITFDDGWRDNYEEAFPVLQRENAPATIFLVSDMIGTRQQFWPERLSTALRVGFERHGAHVLLLPEFAWLKGILGKVENRGTVMTQNALDVVITHVKTMQDADLIDKAGRMEAALRLPPEAGGPVVLDWDQVRDMTGSGLIDIGSHTSGHIRFLPGLPPEVLESEVRQSRATIERMIGKEVTLFCYPNGEMTEAASALVRNTYRAACTTRRGWHSTQDDPFLIRRIGLHEDVSSTRSALLSRIAGWF